MRHCLLLSILLVLTGLPVAAAETAASTSASSRDAPWPSLEAQLAAEKAPAGSALALLIAENQDLGLLRPAEAHDKMGLPPWLRVLWRKQHPGAEFLASDPTGGYPLLLKEVHEWMASHPNLLPGDAARPAGAFQEKEEKAVVAGP